MKTFLVNYTETFTGQVEVKAESESQAMGMVTDMIECDELVPSERYDGHEITVDYATEIEE